MLGPALRAGRLAPVLAHETRSVWPVYAVTVGRTLARHVRCELATALPARTRGAESGAYTPVRGQPRSFLEVRLARPSIATPDSAATASGRDPGSGIRAGGATWIAKLRVTEFSPSELPTRQKYVAGSRGGSR